MLTFSISTVLPSFAYSKGKAEAQPLVSSAAVPATAVTPATTAVQPAEGAAPDAKSAESSDDKQLISAISDLNYKIEYLQSGYNRLNTDLENFRITEREQIKLMNDRIAAIPMPDASKLESLGTESAAMRAELTQARADIADIKSRLERRRQTADEQDTKYKILHSPWLAVGAAGLSIIALIKH